jgi:hypothetical protein
VKGVYPESGVNQSSGFSLEVPARVDWGGWPLLEILSSAAGQELARRRVVTESNSVAAWTAGISEPMSERWRRNLSDLPTLGSQEGL